MGIISELKLGRTLTKLTGLFVEANRDPNMSHEAIRSTEKYQQLTEKLKVYNPDKVTIELLNNMMVTSKIGNDERYTAQEYLLDALDKDGIAIKGM
mgnify:CR=1 FL=1